MRNLDIIGVLTKTKMHTVVVGPLLDHRLVHCVGLKPVHCVGPHSGPLCWTNASPFFWMAFWSYIRFIMVGRHIGPEFGLLCFLLDGGLFISYTFIFLITA